MLVLYYIDLWDIKAQVSGIIGYNDTKIPVQGVAFQVIKNLIFEYPTHHYKLVSNSWQQIFT